MQLRVNQKDFGLYCVCIVYAVAMKTHENRSFSFQTLLHFLQKFIIKSLIQVNL